MAALLPLFPRFVFTILEPISLFAGWIAPLLNPSYFISSQFARPYTGIYDDTSRLLAAQLSNCYGLLALLGLFILNTTAELKTVKAYIWALWIGDVGHVAVSFRAMGWGETLRPWTWSATMWGNTGFTMFLFAVRSAYLLGLFGGVGEREKSLGRREERDEIKRK